MEKAQAEAAAAVSIAVGDDFKTIEHADDVLACDALAGDGAVSGLVIFSALNQISIPLGIPDGKQTLNSGCALLLIGFGEDRPRRANFSRA